MSIPSRRSERGIALLVALVALVVIGTIVAGAFFISGIEHRTAANSAETSQALQAAEAGLQSTVGDWDGSWNLVPVGDSAVLPVTSLGGSTYQARIYPLNQSLLLVESTGRRGSAFQRLALTVRRTAVNLNLRAALSVNAPVDFNGLAYAVTGVNENPLRLLDCPLIPDPVSVVALRSSTATGVGLLDAPHVVGQVGPFPAATGSAVENDTSVTNLTSSVFAPGGGYDQLRAGATITLPPGTYTGVQPVVTNGQCDHSQQLNWGEPWLSGMHPCGTYYPTVHGSGIGSFKLSGGGRGQGVLLVDGDLELTGGFEFNGLILVKGKFKISGTGTRVLGGILAQSGEIQNNSMAGNTVISYSSCSITNALKASGPVTPLPGRAWSQRY